MTRRKPNQKPELGEKLSELAVLLGCKLGRDCGDSYITARNGTIHLDGHGFSVAILLDSARKWNGVKAKLLPFCTLKQDGDTEGVVHLKSIPTKTKAGVLRRALGIRKKRVLTGNQARSLAGNRFKPRDKQGVSGRKNDDLTPDSPIAQPLENNAENRQKDALLAQAQAMGADGANIRPVCDRAVLRPEGTESAQVTASHGGRQNDPY